uniref:G-protein coupled receptor 4-like n=1 Tax=Labrus bergylta TaxID=56723 RepID=A0A3Q3F7F9_9LABR|nr:G-protein coupled receptor 4-like [Labrus bergylta]
MEDFLNNTSQNESYGQSEIDQDYDYDKYKSLNFIKRVATFVIISICLPLTMAAIYSVFFMVRNDRGAPFYVINILISDVIQLSCLTVWGALQIWEYISSFIYRMAVLASVGFMVCLALERYLVIAKPLWYRFNRSKNMSVVVCAVVWASSIVFNFSYKTTCVAFLLPFPLLIFFLVGTVRALSTSISVPSDEKRRIVGILVLVLLIYTLLFLPFLITILKSKLISYTLFIVSDIFLRCSPLANLVLYVFIRKGTIDKLLAAVGCCRKESNDPQSVSM